MFLGSCSGTFYALDHGTGRVRWSYDTRQDGEPSQFHGNPVIAGDLVVTGSDTGAGLTYGFERKTGALRWKTAAGPIESDLVRASGTVFGVTAEGNLAALDLATGKVAWTVKPETSPFRRFHGRAPAVSGDRVFFGGKDGAVYAVRTGTGEILWRRDLGAAITTSPVVAEENLFVGTGSGRLYRLAPATGEVTAEVGLSEGLPHALLASAQGALLALVGEKALVCLEPDLKAVRWTRTAAAGWSTPRPLLLGGAVLAGSEDGRLSAFRIEDGKEVWSGRIDGVPRGTSRDGSDLYVGTLRGTFLAYRGELP